MENIAPQLLQAPGHGGDVLLQRKPTEVGNKAHDHSRLQKEGLLQRIRFRGFGFWLGLCDFLAKGLSFDLLRH